MTGKRTYAPDWKPTAAKKSKPARGKRPPLNAACVACGIRATNRHHVIQKGAPHHGEDIDENLAPLCGSGTSGCHGAFHGNPYVDKAGRRWTAAEVGAAIGVWLRADPARFAYAMERAGAEHIRRFLT